MVEDIHGRGEVRVDPVESLALPHDRFLKGQDFVQGGAHFDFGDEDRFLEHRSQRALGISGLDALELFQAGGKVRNILGGHDFPVFRGPLGLRGGEGRGRSQDQGDGGQSEKDSFSVHAGLLFKDISISENAGSPPAAAARP